MIVQNDGKIILDGFLITQSLHNQITANSLFGIAKKDNSHLGHDSITWAINSDIICNDCNTCVDCQGLCHSSCQGSCTSGCNSNCYDCQGCTTSCQGCNDGCTSRYATACSGCTGGCTGSQASCTPSVATDEDGKCKSGLGCKDLQCIVCTGCRSCAGSGGCHGCVGGGGGDYSGEAWYQPSCGQTWVCQHGTGGSTDTGCNGNGQGCSSVTSPAPCCENCTGSCQGGCTTSCQGGCTSNCTAGCTTSCAGGQGCSSVTSGGGSSSSGGGGSSSSGGGAGGY